MKHHMLAARRLMGRILYAASLAAGVITFAMMWLIDANALSRKVFNAPVPAGVELTQSLLTFAIMLPFGYVLYRREHVNTIFLTSNFPRSVTRWLHAFWMSTGCIVFAAVTYGTFLFALRSYHMNEQVWGATIRFPLYPAKFAVSLGTALIAIQFALDAVLSLVTGDDGDLSAADPDPEKALLHV
ncbi:TRAP transporter small permease subunit [Bosea minatitlanensis]|uniref:TRAP transporter small permease protein n=1 Tax=Bosea minatitlanensis TaxID=128782 RepID=A0ABW0F2Y5_9HYPH|nr:TRAP transporter small permease [Bosea minatitlanensis]MCT4495240.1 TRAP transporter small permease [Bosea minatitlanensis]